jgi:hypothetical protein
MPSKFIPPTLSGTSTTEKLVAVDWGASKVKISLKATPLPNTVPPNVVGVASVVTVPRFVVAAFAPTLMAASIAATTVRFMEFFIIYYLLYYYQKY